MHKLFKRDYAQKEGTKYVKIYELTKKNQASKMDLSN